MHGPDPIILSRSEHPISRSQIGENTLKVMYRLHRQGFKAFLVGGGVRDLLLDRTPKDFDVGTNATPNQVKKLFRNCFLVGRRFRLAHVRFGGEVVEVATFRRQPEEGELPEDPNDHFLFAENVFGTPQEDAFRRDFTINALFYDIASFSIIDYVGGLKDLEARRIRTIGEPEVRFAEDPVRMLRALEFSARLGFTLDPAAQEGILGCAPQIATAAPARIREELMELFRHKVAAPVLRAAAEYGMLAPLLAGFEGGEATYALLSEVDQRTASGVVPEEAFCLASLFLAPFLTGCREIKTIGEALHLANELLTPHCAYFHIAHGIRHLARELLIACFRFRRGPGQRGQRRFVRHPMTPRGLELYNLWCRVAEEVVPAETWQQILCEQEQSSAPADNPPPSSSGRRPRRRGGRRRGRRRSSPESSS
ncbi:MAG: CCA tRNA nucleotidyltransferase [Desulfuromonas sp.]|nr:MAG: CCA tRNA nucleotidyltransferase [Desulfuromonas sp.]